VVLAIYTILKLEMPITLESITKSHKPTKKYDAHLLVDGSPRVVPFGAKGYTDYTINKDPKRKALYLQRHKARENWNDPLTPGFWSRWYLWEEPQAELAEKKLKARFGL